MTDPNADLIGASFTYENGQVYTVTGGVAWSDQYVLGTLSDPGDDVLMDNVMKPAGLVRERVRVTSSSSSVLPGT